MTHGDAGPASRSPAEHRGLDVEERRSGGQNGQNAELPRLRSAPAEVERDCVALIDERPLERDCFARSLRQLYPRMELLDYSSASQFVRASGAVLPPRLILLNVGGRALSEPDIRREFEVLAEAGADCPIVVMSPREDIEQMIAAFDAGAAGYVATSFAIEDILVAAKLAARGGAFVRSERLGHLRDTVGQPPAVPPGLECLTLRQSAVADALRRGKANKTIAYELSMCESTVKVHVRDIMRKLNATNRTEAALRLNSILRRQERPADPQPSAGTD